MSVLLSERVAKPIVYALYEILGYSLLLKYNKIVVLTESKSIVLHQLQKNYEHIYSNLWLIYVVIEMAHLNRK